MKKIRILLPFIILVVITSCQKRNEYLPPTGFVYEIPDTPNDPTIKLGAYYQSKNEAYWTAITDSSVLGKYNSVNTAVLKQHDSLGGKAGLDFFIFPWNGTADNAQLNAFSAVSGSKTKMVISYNFSHLKVSVSAPLQGAKMTQMINECKTLANDYFAKDFYYKIGGKPVIMLTSLSIQNNTGTIIDFKRLRDTLSLELGKLGINPFLLGEIPTGWIPPQRYSEAIKQMDAIAITDWSTDNYDRSVFFPSYIDISWKNWSDSARNWNIDFVPVVFPGFDDRLSNSRTKKFVMGRDDKFYKDFCNVAKRNMGKNKMVIINSWNNFKENTHIEPSATYGDKYIRATFDNFKK